MSKRELIEYTCHCGRLTSAYRNSTRYIERLCYACWLVAHRGVNISDI